MPDTADAVQEMAIIALHKQLRSVAEVRLTREDIEAHFNSQDDAIALAYDEATGDILLRHKSPKDDA